MKKNRKRRDTISYINDCAIKHNNLYDYSKTVYVNMQTNVVVTCKVHGDFTQNPNHHLKGRGCRLCAFEKQANRQKDNTQSFINKALKIHGDKYDYSKTNYGKNAHDKVLIVCKEHGEFFISPNMHLNKKANCPKCSKKSFGWTKTSWKHACIDKVPKLYIIKCYNEKEVFYKIGITCRASIEDRFKCQHWMPYNWEIIKVVESKDAEYIFNLERQMHTKNKIFKYNPELFFDGFSECFSEYVDVNSN